MVLIGLQLEKWKAFHLSFPACCNKSNKIKLGRFIDILWVLTKTLRQSKYPINWDTEGSIKSVCINGVSVLSGLNLEKT